MKKVIAKLKLNSTFKALTMLIRNPIYGVRILKGVQKHGLNWALDKSRGKLISDELSEGYHHKVDILDLAGELSRLKYQPLISVVMPVYNVEVKWLTPALESVWESSYTNYELILVDDASSDPELRTYLHSISQERTRIYFNEANHGISESSNRGVAQANGEFIVMMDHDDLLDRHALFHIAKAISDFQPEVIYTDEDKVDMKGNYKNPFYKPDWSPDLLRSQMYIGHIFAFRRDLFEKVGGFRTEFDGAQDYDLALRMTERSTKICHIPEVLYSWREINTSTAMNPDSKPYAHIAGLKVLDSHLKRVYGDGAYAEETEHYYVYEARYPVPESLLSVIIPFRMDEKALLECIANILSQKMRMTLEIIILDSTLPSGKGLELSEDFLRGGRIRIVEGTPKPSFASVLHQGIHEAKGDVLLFLHPGLAFITGNGMQRLAEKAMRTDAGLVGAMVLDQKGSIIHAGLRMTNEGALYRIYKGALPLHYGTPFVSPLVTRNVTAIDKKCMAMSKNTALSVGNFRDNLAEDEIAVHLGLSAMDKNLNNIYDGGTRLVEKPSDSKEKKPVGNGVSKDGVTVYGFDWEYDPFYNTNLDAESEIPKLRDKANRTK